MDTLQQRGEAMARRAIGTTQRVRTGYNTVVTGRVVECRVARLRNRGASRIVQFEVVMECGTAAVRRTFTLETLTLED